MHLTQFHAPPGSFTRYVNFPCLGIWLLIFCARSAMALGEKEPCFEILAPSDLRPKILIRAGVETSILIYKGPPFELSRNLLNFFPLGGRIPDPELPKIELYYNQIQGVGAIVSRLGDPHENLIEFLITPLSGASPIGGVRWFSAKAPETYVNSTILRHLPGPEVADKYFEVVILAPQAPR